MRIQQLPATLANSFGGSPQTSSNIAPIFYSFSLSVHQSVGDMQSIILFQFDNLKFQPYQNFTILNALIISHLEVEV